MFRIRVHGEHTIIPVSRTYPDIDARGGVKHGIAFRVDVRPFESREAVMNWIIDNQLGRRNMTPEAKSYLRGKRYQLEKKREGHPSEELHQNDGETAQRLAQEYGVGQATIERDADFAEAVDTLEEQVRQDIRQAMLKRKRRDDKARLTKKQTTRAGTAVKSVLRARV